MMRLRCGKVARERLDARRLFGDQQAVARDRSCSARFSGGIDDVDAAGDHRRSCRWRASRHARRCRCPRARPETTTTPSRAQFDRQLAREAARRGRGVARADHRDASCRASQREVAAHDQRRRARCRARRAAADSRHRRGTDSARRASRPRRSRARPRRRRSRVGARPPPRAARSGSASIAASALPNRAISWR